ncbi:MAG TPA: hypothetical protein VFQ61_25755 [Polyangiaceae bacterium]|nr:hypothetical protein [Polyangiaceae bacterium]
MPRKRWSEALSYSLGAECAVWGISRFKRANLLVYSSSRVVRLCNAYSMQAIRSRPKLVERFAPRAPALFLVILAFQLNGCEAVKGIFKAGFWVGALFVIGILGLVAYLLGRKRS